jgi:valyl-tRNA synthetase
LLYVFESALRLLHPFMPFITEELWQGFPHSGESIVIAAYPELESHPDDQAAESHTEMVQDLITKVRNIRAEINVEAKQTVPLRIASTEAAIASLIDEARNYIQKLAFVDSIELVKELSGDKLSAQAVAAGCSIEVPLAGVIDPASERTRLSKAREKLIQEVTSIQNQLANSDFVSRAPSQVVDEKKRRQVELKDQIDKLSAGIDRFN